MRDEAIKAIENRVRRHARARGYVLERNPVRTSTAADYGRYRLVRTGVPASPGYPFTLAQVENALSGAPAAPGGRYSAPPSSALGGTFSAPNDAEGPRVLSAVVGRNRDLLAEVSRLWITANDVVADVTFGSGGFWHDLPGLPHIFHDIRIDGVDFRSLSEQDSSIDVLAFDPPYRPLNGGTPERQHALYGLEHTDSISDVLALYRDGLREAYRILRPGGRVLVKCADLSVGARLHLVHIDVLSAMTAAGFELADLFVLVNEERVPTNGRQRRARRAHSYLLVGAKR